MADCFNHYKNRNGKCSNYSICYLWVFTAFQVCFSAFKNTGPATNKVVPQFNGIISPYG